MLLDKLESGLLGFETERGTVYVHPGGWQRVHLLWIFRHFKSLPVKLLSSRQARLVESLYHASPLSLPDQPDEEFVIGTVEQAKFPAVPPAPASKQIKTEVSAPIPARSEKKKKKKHRVVEKPAVSKPERPVFGRIVWSRVGMALGAGALCLVGAVSAWHRIQASPSSQAAAEKEEGTISPAWVEPVALKPVATTQVQPALATEVSENPSSAGIQAAAITEVVQATQTAPSVSEKPQSAQTEVSQVARITRVSKPADSRKPENRAAANVAESQVQPETTRIQISRPPRKVVYPEYPATKAQGKVALKAVLSPEGAVREVKVLSGNKTLAAAASRAVRQWHYSPYYKDGQAVETETSINVVFISADAISISFPATEAVSR